MIQADQQVKMQLNEIITKIQDRVVEGYLLIKDPQLQQFAISMLLNMSVAALNHLKTAHMRTTSPMKDSKKDNGLDSAIYWVINFTP